MDTGQIDTARLEDEMRRTRARIDAKLDALQTRLTVARRNSGPWAIGALVALSTAAMFWFRRRKHQQGLPRYSGIPRYGEALSR
jgi:hypothetical protein